MAVKKMTAVKGDLNKITEFAFEAATTASDGLSIVLPASDEYVVILIQNTSADTAYDITLKKPTKPSYAGATADVTHELGAGEFAIIRVESARYANTDGTVLLIPENVAVKAVTLY